jgi:arylsulfatase A
MGPVMMLTQRRVKNLQIPVKKLLLFLTSLCALLNAPGELRATEGSASPPPNIVLILADDLGYGDCSVTNSESKIRTPHIEQLAKEGLSFSDAHSAASTCTPSRYGLLTGINPVRTGVLNTLLAEGRAIISKDEKTIAHLLKDQGYATHMIGKWHLGFDTGGKKKDFDFDQAFIGGPIDRGFDSYFGIHSSPGAFPLFYLKDRKAIAKPSEKTSWVKMKIEGATTTIHGLKSPDFELDEASPTFCKKAVELIKKQADSESPQPFFLYYASPIPHSPWVPSKAFKGESGHGDYGDFVMQLDDVVGQINQALKDTGLDKNTLLIFSSDNGPGPHATRLMTTKGHHCAGPLRGSKASFYEGGHRVPFIAKWPGKISPGNKTTAIINFSDVFATFAELFDSKMTAYPSVKDSHSFLPALLGSSDTHTHPVMINGHYSIRLGGWKLSSKGNLKHSDSTKIKASQFELHKLTDDLAEQHDLSEDQPERANQLLDQLQSFIKQRQPK